MRAEGKYLISYLGGETLQISDYTRRLCYEYAKILGYNVNNPFFNEASMYHKLYNLIEYKINKTTKYNTLREYINKDMPSYLTLLCYNIQCNIRYTINHINKKDVNAFFKGSLGVGYNPLNVSDYLKEFPTCYFNDVFDIIEEYIKEKDYLLYKKIIVDYVNEYKDYVFLDSNVKEYNINRYSDRIKDRMTEITELEKNKTIDKTFNIKELEQNIKEFDKIISNLFRDIEDNKRYEKFLIKTFGEYLN